MITISQIIAANFNLAFEEHINYFDEEEETYHLCMCLDMPLMEKKSDGFMQPYKGIVPLTISKKFVRGENATPLEQQMITFMKDSRRIMHLSLLESILDGQINVLGTLWDGTKFERKVVEVKYINGGRIAEIASAPAFAVMEFDTTTGDWKAKN